MKKVLNRTVTVSLSNAKRISYSQFFQSVLKAQQTLIENNVNLDRCEICFEGIWSDYDGDVNKDDAELTFSYSSLETDEEYAERLRQEERLLQLSQQKEKAHQKKKELQAKQALALEKELYLKLKKKYE